MKQVFSIADDRGPVLVDGKPAYIVMDAGFTFHLTTDITQATDFSGKAETMADLLGRSVDIWWLKVDEAGQVISEEEE